MTAPRPTADAVKSVRCPRCGAAFDCGRHTEPFDCWCKALPPVPANRLDARGRCLCPECLAEVLTPAPGEPGAFGETPPR